MANIKLTGNTWDTSSVYDDAQGKTQKQINAKAATNDGYFEDMTVGTAEQLLSSKYTEDKVPYSFRRTGGELDVGKRAEEMIVGGTVVWNQLFNKNNYPATTTDNDITFTNNGNGSVTINGTASARAAYPLVTLNGLKDHVLFFNSWNSDNGYYVGNSAMGIDSNKKYMYKITSSGGNGLNIMVTSGAVVNNVKIYPQCFDLTKMFGSTIADYILSLETAHAGDGVAYFRSFFPNTYYAYNYGILMSVNAARHETVGKNLLATDCDVLNAYFGYTASTGINQINAGANNRMCIIPVLPNTTYTMTRNRVAISSTGDDVSSALFTEYPTIGAKGRAIIFENSGTAIKNSVTFTTGANERYYTVKLAEITKTDFTATLAASQLEISPMATAYEPYEKHTYPLDSTLTLRGIPKLDSNNKLYYDGDTYESDGKVTRKYRIVDLGTLIWTYVTNDAATSVPYFVALLSDRKPSVNSICSKYLFVGGRDSLQDKTSASYNLSNNANVCIADSSYTDAATFKTAMSGVYLVYELATPTTESASPYTNPQVCDGNGTEEYVDAGVLAQERDVSVPVGHETKYGEDLVGKLEALPPIPDAPTTNGAYNLRVVVSGGEPTYSWVSV